jgi:DNA-binding MarR family transcriptional regulator
MNASAVAARRRSPTAGELAVWRDFIETTERLRSIIEGRMQSDSALSAGDYAVLLALSEAAANRMRSSELAAHINWERSRLSHHLGRMEKRGLITREDCATDSRGAEIVLAPDGAAAFRRASPSHLHAIQQHFVDALTPEHLDAVGEITEAIRVHLAAAE